MQKNLVMSKKSSTFAPAFEREGKNRALSAAGLEHLPYKQRVGGSNPSAPTKEASHLTRFFHIISIFNCQFPAGFHI